MRIGCCIGPNDIIVVEPDVFGGSGMDEFGEGVFFAQIVVIDAPAGGDVS